MNDMTPAFDAAAIGEIEGWLSPEATEITARLLGFQSRSRIRGGILELGVYKGKYLALLAALSRAENDRVVGVDAFYERHGVFLPEIWRNDAIERILSACERAGSDRSRVHLIAGLTTDVRGQQLRSLVPAGFRFASIDAGHEAESVAHDLSLVAPVLADGGVIAVDDVFNPVVPGVAEGVCRFFERHAQVFSIAAFATGGNKLFCTSRDWHDRFYRYCREIIEAGGPPDFIGRSQAQQRDNDANAFVPRFFGHPVAVFR